MTDPPSWLPRPRHPGALLPTQYGEVEISVRDADLLMVSAKPWINGLSLQYRGRTHAVLASFEREESGEWTLRERQTEVDLENGDDAPPGARRAILDEVEGAVRHWTHEQPESVFTAARAAHLLSRWYHVQREARRTEEALLEQADRFAELIRQRHEIEESLGQLHPFQP